MEITYCDKCGFRIPEEDFTAGRALKVDGKPLCGKCRPEGKKPSHARVSLSKITVEARPSAAHASSRPLPESGRSHPQPLRKDAGSKYVVFGVAGGLLFGVVVGVILLSTGKSPDDAAVGPASVPVVAAPDTGTTSAIPVGPPKNVPTPVTRPDEPRPDPAPVSEAEKAAQEAFDKLIRFEGLDATDTAGRIARLEQYLAGVAGDMLPAARARALLSQLKDAAANPVTDPATPPKETPANTTVDLAAGLVGHWRFDEADGAAIEDSSGSKNNGATTGAAHAPGKFGTALSLNGAEYALVPDAASLNPTAAITIATFAKANGWTGNPRIVQKGTADNQYRLLAEHGQLAIHVNTAGGRVNAPLPSAGQWHHLASTYDGTWLRLYVDGVEVASGRAKGAIPVTADTLCLGSKYANGVNSVDCFKGLLDDLRIYSRALNPAEIKALAEQTATSTAGSGESDVPAIPAAGPEGRVVFLKRDDKRGGDWLKDLGRDGYVVFGGAPGNKDLVKQPDYIRDIAYTGRRHLWLRGADTRGLEDPGAPGTFLSSCIPTEDTLTVRIEAKHELPYRFSVYALDFDRNNRAQRFELLAGGTSLYRCDMAQMATGTWLHFQVKGSIDVRVTRTNAGRNAILSGFFFDPVAAKAQAGPVGYPGFQAEFYEMLRKRDADSANLRAKRAETDEQLKNSAAEVSQDRTLAAWLPELDAAALKGVSKLNDGDDFDLKLCKGNSLRVGKKAEYHVKEVQNDTIQLESRGVTVPVALDAIQREVRDVLALLGLPEDAGGLLRRALLQLLIFEGGDTAAAGIRATIDRAQAAGATESEAAPVRRLLAYYAGLKQNAEASETAAAADWRELLRLAETDQWKQLAAAAAQFKAKYENTRFFPKKAEELKALTARAELMLGLNKGIIGYWKFDEGTGTVASDASGQGRNGTLSTGVLWCPGRTGKAVFFDGKNSCVTLPDGGDMDNVQDGNYTLAAWYRPSSVPSGSGKTNTAKHGILIKHGYHSGLSYDSGGAFVMQHAVLDAIPNVGSRKRYPAGSWYFVVGVVSKTEGSLKLYVNGQLDGVASYGAGKRARDYNNTAWRIGIAFPNQKEYRWPADGAADEVRIYKRCLSDAEVKALFEEAGK